VLFRSIGATNSRGAFVAGFLDSSSGNLYSDLVLFQFDPRNGYVMNSWWGGNGDFEPGTNANIEPGFSFATHDQFERIGGVSVEDDGFVSIVGFGDVHANGIEADPFFLSFDVDAGLVDEIGTTGQAGHPIGISSIDEGMGEAFQMQTLMPVGTIDLDIAGINLAFARVAYSPQALQSGAIETIFTQHFIETAQDPVFCAIDSLVSMVPSELLRNANFQSGIGRTAYHLRNGLPANHPCFAPFQTQIP